MTLGRLVAHAVACLSLLTLGVSSENAADPEYDYGDLSYSYDTLLDHSEGRMTSSQPGKMRTVHKIASHVTENRPLPLPLCCPKGEVFNQVNCVLPPSSFDWMPMLGGAPRAPLAFNGFPKCTTKPDYVQTYQKEVHFNVIKATLFLPPQIRVKPVERNDYCIAKVYDLSDTTCEEFQTRIFTCFSTDKEPKFVMWTAVTFSHLFLFLTLLSYFLVSELRCLQGQYMICFLISLLIYNICLLPGSVLSMDIGDVSCIALGAVKYFFFCGTFLWFNTICFDLWRTLRTKQDISGRRRFLSYSAYSWTVGAVLTTVVLVMPYMKDDKVDNSRDDPLKDANYDACKLKMEMNMILQLAQLFSLLIDLIFLILATCSICSYSKFGNGLPRCEASLCLKQGWKLFTIMFVHMISLIDGNILEFPIQMWLYVLLESAAIFGIFAYRRTIVRKILSGKFCQSNCITKRENGSVQEKGQLTVA